MIENRKCLVKVNIKGEKEGASPQQKFQSAKRKLPSDTFFLKQNPFVPLKGVYFSGRLKDLLT